MKLELALLVIVLILLETRRSNALNFKNINLTDAKILQDPFLFHRLMNKRIKRMIHKGNCENWKYKKMVHLNRLIPLMNLTFIDRTIKCKGKDISAFYYFFAVTNILSEFQRLFQETLQYRAINKENDNPFNFTKSLEPNELITVLNNILNIPDIERYYINALNYGKKDGKSRQTEQEVRAQQIFIHLVNKIVEKFAQQEMEKARKENPYPQLKGFSKFREFVEKHNKKG